MRKLLLLLAVAALLVPAAFASTAGWEFSSVGSTGTDGNWTFGEVFTVNQNITVDFLGYFNDGNMQDQHPVALFDANGNMLASTTIDNTSAFFTQNFLYNAIAPVTLLAGQTYVVEGVSGSDNYAWNDSVFTIYAPINVLGNNWVLENGLNFNGTGVINDVSDGYWGPNFGWDPALATPEPGSLMLLGSGIVGLAGMLRRKMM